MEQSKYRKKIKLFISSTFMDMHEDRDYLNHFVFPLISSYCQDRYINFIPVDLRWGITEEESKNGLVVNSCLSEINDCRPFFIGILGGRYGWCPNKDEVKIIDRNLIKDEEWIMSCVKEGLSVTEIEIRYAALRNMDISHAAFFLRNCDVTHPESYYEVPGTEAEAKLHALKQKIKSQDKYKYYQYSTPSELGEFIIREIIHFIDTEFPEENQDREQAILYPHLESLKRRPTYLDLSDAFSIIDSFWNHDNALNVIWGFPGVGTSTVLVNYVHYLNNLNKGWKVVYFDFAAVPYGTDLLEAYDEFVSLEINRPSKGIKTLVCIDNAHILNSYEASRYSSIFSLLNFSNSEIRYLLTLSYECPVAHELILSGLPFRTLYFKGYSQKSINEFANHYALQFGKQLSETQLKLISSCRGLDNPTDLVILMDALVNYGHYESLDNYIDEFLSSCSTIENWEFKSNILADGLFKKTLDIYMGLFEEVGLSEQFINVLLSVCLLDGVSEWVLIDALDLPEEQWYFLLPAVMHFCKGTGERLYLIKETWKFEVIKYQASKSECLALLKLDEYLFNSTIDGHQVLKIFIWLIKFLKICNDDNLYESVSESILSLKQKIIEKYFAFDEFIQLSGEDIHNLYLIFSIQTTKEDFIELVKHNIPQDATKACWYIVGIANFCESHNLLDYAASCYVLLSQHPDIVRHNLSLAFKAQAYLIEGNAVKAIELLNQSGLNGGNVVSNLFRRVKGSYRNFQLSSVIANSTLLKSYLIKCDFDSVFKIYAKLLKAIYSIDSKGHWIGSLAGNYLAEAISEYGIFFSMIGDAKILNEISDQMDKLNQGFHMYGIRMGTNYAYNRCLFKTIFAIRTGDLDNLNHLASTLIYSALNAFGEDGYKSGRAILLNAVSTYLRTGHRYEIDGLGFNINDSSDYIFESPLPYRREVPEGCHDEDVIEFINTENRFYDGMLNMMNNKEPELRDQILSIYHQRKQLVKN